MATMRVIALDADVEDKATREKGQVTHVRVGIGAGTTWYCVQPKRLDQKKKIPSEAMWAEEGRLVTKDSNWVDIEMPVEMIGTEVTEKASGFKGLCVGLITHHGGCVHAEVQAPGRDEDGKLIKLQDFDILRLKGEKVPKFTPKEAEQRKKDKPSPAGHPALFDDHVEALADKARTFPY